MSNLNIKDPFEQIVKSKLADYNVEVPYQGWDRLESSLLASRKMKVVRKRWIVSTLSAVAAVLIGVIFMFQNMNNDIPMNLSEYQINETESTTKDKAKEAPAMKEREIKTKRSTQSLIANNTSSIKDKDLSSYSAAQEAKTLDAIISDEKEIIANPIIDDPLKKNNEVDEGKKQQLIQDFINEGKRSLTSSDETKTPKTKNRSKNSISLTAQTGLSGSQQSTSTPFTLRSSLSETYGVYALNKMKISYDEVEIKPESEINHMQPVSFGVLTSFAITHKLQIETGLLYTYLSSETQSQSADYNESEKIQFHYLGIPLNLNYTLLSINKLDMFVSAGAMIEKDIHGRIRYNDEKKASTFNSGYASNKASSIKQHNPQISITSGLGITYPIYEKANLFGKIGGRYNINANNEYRTYYSDEKFGLDIQMGIKFNF